MKKVLCLVLAVAMALSLGVTAMASFTSPAGLAGGSGFITVAWNDNASWQWTHTTNVAAGLDPATTGTPSGPIAALSTAGAPWVTQSSLMTQQTGAAGTTVGFLEDFQANFGLTLENNIHGLLRRFEVPQAAITDELTNNRTSFTSVHTAAGSGLDAMGPVMVYHLPNGPFWFGASGGTTDLIAQPNPDNFDDVEALRGNRPGRMTFYVDFTGTGPGTRPSGLQGSAGSANPLGVYYPLSDVPSWFTNYSAWLAPSPRQGSTTEHVLTLDFQIDWAEWLRVGGQPQVSLRLGAEAPLSQIVVDIDFLFGEVLRTIWAGTDPSRNRAQNQSVTIAQNFGNTAAAVTAWNALPAGESLNIASISRVQGNAAVDPRSATGSMRIESPNTGATRVVTFQVLSLVGSGNIYDPVFTVHRARPTTGVGSWQVQLTGWRVIPGGQAEVLPPVGQVPNTWRIDGLSASGEMRIQNALNTIINMTGDDTDWAWLQPADFTWRIPNAEIPDVTSNTGFATGRNWETYADVLLYRHASGGTTASSVLARSEALRNIHFERVDLRTTRTVNFARAIRDVDFQWHSDSGRMGIRIRTPEFMALVGTTTVEFDMNMSVTAGSNRHLGRVTLDVANNRVYVYENQEFIDPNRREYLRAEDTIRDIDVYAGEGVTFRRNITRGQSIYVQAQLATHDAWQEYFQRHAELVDVIVIHHYGMAHAASQVSIERAGTYFVFNADRDLIGTTAETDLPFSEVYFLTTAIIDLGGATAPAEPPAGDDSGELGDPNVPVTGGDGGASNNVNFNPGTGR